MITIKLINYANRMKHSLYRIKFLNNIMQNK